MCKMSPAEPLFTWVQSLLPLGGLDGAQVRLVLFPLETQLMILVHQCQFSVCPSFLSRLFHIFQLQEPPGQVHLKG